MAESSLLKFCVTVQEVYKRVTPIYEVEDLIPANPFVFHIIPVIFVGIYLYLLQVLPDFQKKHNLLGSKRNKNIVFVAWNAFLTIYSGITSFYVFTWYVVELNKKGSFYDIYCTKTNEHYHGPNVFWYYSFSVTKFFELFDTILLIIKNPTRSPMFLHWFHHATIVFSCWWSFAWHYNPFFFPVMVNTFIHFNMYLYYALTPFFKPPWAFLLTVLQIVQMGCYMFVSISFFYAYFTRGCSGRHKGIINGYNLFLATAYGWLFFQFMLKRYFGKKKKKKEIHKDT